jgi:hypothetical protein
MKRKLYLASALLLTCGAIASQAVGQSGGSSGRDAALQKLKEKREAAIAAAKARAAAATATTTTTAAPTTTATTTAAPTTTTTTTATPTATTTTTATPTATTTTTATPSATATTSASAAASASASAAASASVAPKPAEALILDLAALKQTRPERRKVEIAALQARWGTELLKDSRATEELKRHAQRTAYLQRIRALANKANDAKTVQAVDILITKEDTRNADAMNALRSGALPTVAGASK